MSEDLILRDFAVSKKDLVDNFQRGTETALSRANFLRTTKLETMQAFVMYMVCTILLVFPPTSNVVTFTSHSCGTATICSPF